MDLTRAEVEEKLAREGSPELRFPEILKDERGFHCFQHDLLIVVMIIGILAAIAIPKLLELVKRSQADKPAVVSPVERAR